MAETDLESPELFLNRELSWLEFDERVLQQGRSPEVPLMERLKFLAIVSSNLDEFFMIRVAGLKQQLAAGLTASGTGRQSPGEQLDAISRRAHRLVADQSAAIAAALAELRPHGFHLIDITEVTAEQRSFLESYFLSEVLPVLTPLAVDELSPFPVLPGLTLNLAILLGPPRPQQDATGVAVVPVPANLPRFVPLPGPGGLCLVRLEQVVRTHVGRLFPGQTIEAACEFRLTRDADVPINEDEAEDLLSVVEDAVRERRRRAVVRLALPAGADPRLRQWLTAWCDIEERDVYDCPVLLDAAALMGVASRPGFEQLMDPPWPPQPPRDLAEAEDLWQALQDRDVLLLHPYESFDAVVDLLERAASDPGVLAIKQTLYRTSGDSPIVKALARAAEQGKQVIVLVELMARFDEARNVLWARRLEDAGCHVIYGIAGLKTHAKVLLIVRREAHGIRRYVHLSTGNYNDRTARLYSDIGLMTADRDLAADASAFFNMLTGYSQEVGWTKLVISPTGLRQRLMDLIEREIRASTLDRPGLIMAKMNSLQDRAICQALYRASQAGVKVRLNVRGVCCLRPGVKGVSDNIEVTSIVDRFLEHARIFYFGNGGHEEVYLSSADWMTRNLDGRLEVLFPVLDPRLSQRLVGWLGTWFGDNVKAWRLRSDGTYARVTGRRSPLRAQEELYRQAVEAAQSRLATAARFRPLTSPDAGQG